VPGVGLLRFVVPVLLAGCSRGSGAPDAGSLPEQPSAVPTSEASGSASLPSAAPQASRLPSAPILPPNPAPSGEAKRSTVASLEADVALRPYLSKLREHFTRDGKEARGPFAVQRVDLAEGRAALLVARPDESDPVALAVDPVAGQILFVKEHPTAGIAPPVAHHTIAPAPERGVAVFAWVASMHIVAARMWADDANPYADVEVFRPSACDELTVAYQAGFGWLAACASQSGTRAQRLRENLTGAWGPEGITVGTNSPVGRATITFEGRSRWRLGQVAKAVGGDRRLTFRYDADGQPLP
jgi:hypothetical protein